MPNCKFPFLPTIHNLDWHSHIDHALPLVVFVESCIYVVVLYEVFIHEISDCIICTMQFIYGYTICSLSLSRVVSKRWQFYCPGPSRLPSPLDQTTVNLICFCLIDLMIFDLPDDFLLIWLFSIDLMISNYSDDFQLIIDDFSIVRQVNFLSSSASGHCQIIADYDIHCISLQFENLCFVSFVTPIGPL